MHAFIKTTFLEGNKYKNTLPNPGMPETVGSKLTFHREYQNFVTFCRFKGPYLSHDAGLGSHTV
jgi:hypothetical protein